MMHRSPQSHRCLGSTRMMSALPHKSSVLGTKPDLRQSAIRFSPPTPSYPPSTTLLLPSFAALHQCLVPLETLVRHPRRVVHTYEDLRLTVLGLCSCVLGSRSSGGHFCFL